MADNVEDKKLTPPEGAPKTTTPPNDDKPKVAKARYFMSQMAGLAFRDGDDEVARFVPYYETYQGDRVRVGYLKVAGGKLAARIADDPNTEEIDADEYKKAVKQQQAGY